MADGQNNDDAAAATDDGMATQMCKVYDSNDFFTIFVQILLGFAALAALYIKRLREVPRRTFSTWFLDISKQGFGACYAHVLNMVIASIITQITNAETILKDQCAWYAISYLIDTTLGLVLAILLLRLLDHIAKERDWMSLRHSGVYTGPTAMTHWAHQVCAWMIILTIVKIIIFGFMVVFSNALAWVGSILFAPLQGNIRFELVFVMILFPGLLNLIYFWIADSYLKADPQHSGAHESESAEMEEKKASLLTEEEVASYAVTTTGTPTTSSRTPESAMV